MFKANLEEEIICLIELYIHMAIKLGDSNKGHCFCNAAFLRKMNLR